MIITVIISVKPRSMVFWSHQVIKPTTTGREATLSLVCTGVSNGFNSDGIEKWRILTSFEIILQPEKKRVLLSYLLPYTDRLAAGRYVPEVVRTNVARRSEAMI